MTLLISLAVPQIGFDPISYTVDEDAGEVVLRIRTSDPTAFVNATGALFYTNVTGGTATSSGGMIHPHTNTCTHTHTHTHTHIGRTYIVG